MKLRETVTKAIETLRANKVIGSSLEVDVAVTGDNYTILNKYEKEFKSIFITSQAYVTENAPANILNEYVEGDITVWVTKAEGEKCERCWKFRKLGEHKGHETICTDCFEAVSTEALV